MYTAFQVQIVRQSLVLLRSALLVALLLSGFSSAAFAQSEGGVLIWKFIDGREFQAEFVRLTDDGVVLKSAENGREAELKFSRLSIASHFQAMKLGNPEAYNKPLIKAEVKPIVAEPAFTIDVDRTLQYPFPDDPTVEQWLDVIVLELNENKNSMVLWHMLPEKMQGDVEDVMILAVEKVGSGMVTQIKTLMGELNTIVQDKRDFVLNNQFVKSQPGVAEQIESLWPQIAGLVGAVTAEEHWEMSNFQKGKVVPWMANFMGQVVPHAEAMGEAVRPLLPPGAPSGDAKFSYKIVKQSNGRATVELELEGQPNQTVELQKVGKKWVVPGWMNQMRQGVDNAKKELDQFAGIPFGVNLAIGGVVGAAGKLAAAESQAEFDTEIQGLVGMLQGMIPAGGPGGPGGPGGRPGPPR